MRKVVIAEDEHIRLCKSCQRRVEFMNRVATEAVIIAQEMDMGPRTVTVALVDMIANIALQNGTVDDMAEQMIAAIDVVDQYGDP